MPNSDPNLIRFRVILAATGMSLREFCHRFNVSSTTLYRTLRLQNSPRTLAKIEQLAISAQPVLQTILIHWQNTTPSPHKGVGTTQNAMRAESAKHHTIPTA